MRPRRAWSADRARDPITAVSVQGVYAAGRDAERGSMSVPTRDARDLASELERLAAQVARLRPDWRDGERFYETRSEVIARLRSLARSSLAVRTVTRFVPAV